MPALVSYFGSPHAPPPLAAKVALVLVSELADDAWLQEIGEDEFLDWEDALELAEDLIACVRDL